MICGYNHPGIGYLNILFVLLSCLNNFVLQLSRVSSFDLVIPLDLLPLAGDSEPETREFLNRMTEILMDFLHKTFDRSSKILDFHHPEQLLEILDLTLPNQPKNIDQLLADCRDTLTYQVKTGS